ncbi:protein SDA1 homolog isoform X2 [Arachis ipaensis]|uniref:protein SDA1 homolog isoform X2 n=1 Tax=Arachis ipaensis TaxID=130454 RepID=UPI000A2B5AE2|nr:protein SDA1 homolog isoform X2 [Arachis ipaensis]
MSSHGHGASSAAPVAEHFLSAGRRSEKLSLSTLQSMMKCDPESYLSQLDVLQRQFNSSLELFEQKADKNFASITGIGSDPTLAKYLGDRAMLLAHVTPLYPEHLANFPAKLATLIRCAARHLPSGLRCRLAQALILLVNRKILDIGETLSLFMELQTLGDRTLKKLAFDHVIHSIKRMNQKHKNEAKNRALQNVLFSMLQEEDEVRAKTALVTLCELHRKKYWFDERTANAICTACFHPASRIMRAALLLLLDYEKIENDSNSDESDIEDETKESPQVILSKETIYKAHHQGTAASKKKKKAKLERVMRRMKRKQRLSTERNNNSYYSPLNHLNDAQGFAEKLLSRCRKCEIFEVKMMMLKLIARTVGVHRLILSDFYPFLQKYIQPRQLDITNLFAAVVQACHDKVPPNDVEPLFKQIVTEFIHDRSRPELMNEDLLRDLASYKKDREKAVSVAARSLIGLFRELNPSLLVKKDRGWHIEVSEQEDDDDVHTSGDDESVGTNRRKKDPAKKRKFADFQVPNSDQLSLKRVDSSMFDVHVKRRRSKEERSALAKAGREDRGKYLPRKAANQKKTGGLSNRQKERKKKMPVVAKREKIAKSHLEKKKNNQRAGKQFRGRKA